MKENRFRDMDAQELQTELKGMEEQMFRLRFQLSMGQTDGVKKVRELRKDRARMLTALRERELAEAKK
jgi:large subunit ribosomal protein L29